jgi:hypothetical protein
MGFFKFGLFNDPLQVVRVSGSDFVVAPAAILSKMKAGVQRRLAWPMEFPRDRVAGKLAGREVTVKRPWLACHARQPIACYQDPPGSHLDGSDEQSERDFAEACAG